MREGATLSDVIVIKDCKTGIHEGLFYGYYFSGHRKLLIVVVFLGTLTESINKTYKLMRYSFAWVNCL